MSAYRRASERLSVSMEAELHICDPETHKPLSPPLPARVVDLSAGGARIEFMSLPANYIQLFGPGTVVSLRLPDEVVELVESVFITVSWFRSRNEPNGTLLAAVGGYFSTIADRDRTALLELAARKAGPAKPSTRRMSLAWPAAAMATALAIGLLIHSVTLRDQVASLHSQLGLLRHELSRQRELTRAAAARPPVLERARPVEVVTAARPSPSAPPKANEPAAAPRPAAQRSGLEYKVMESPSGIDMTNLELLNGDFVGVVASTATDEVRVRVELEFACPPGSCQCETPEMRVRANGRAEFACTPEKQPGADLPLVSVRLRPAAN